MSCDIRWVAGTGCRRAILVLAVAFAGLTARLDGRPLPIVTLLRDDSCPLRVLDVRRQTDRESPDLVIVATISNPTGRPAKSLVVTAALVDSAGRVANLHMASIDGGLAGRSDREFQIAFEGFTPGRDDRVAFGIQAIRWSKTEEWRGVLKVVAAPGLLARNAAIPR